MAAPLPPPALLLLLLLVSSAGALPPSSEAQGSAYGQLSQSLKRGVDLVLEKLRSHAAIQQHLVFLRSLSASDVQVESAGRDFSARISLVYRLGSFMQPGFGVAFIYHHFYLKATTCPKETADVTGCRHRNDRVRRPVFLLQACLDRIPAGACALLCVRPCSH